MKYISTRGNYKKIKAAEAIRLGMVPTGGLFVPATLPKISQNEIKAMSDSSYQEIAFQILNRFLTDYTKEELIEVINATYNKSNFAVSQMAPVTKLSDNSYILELWHGPTAAFKDMALQLMPHLLVKAINKVNMEREIVILVATSGDTGKAALEGFKDVAGVKIIVFYPQTGVSKIQELQMITTGGKNTTVVAVNGNFDDCQTAVKKVFQDQDFKELLVENSYQFSSANSINWGRLVPQIIYYFAAYANLLKKKEIVLGDKINISVPTGNFGNILAGYYAYRLGLPVAKFICASNENKILTDFLATGVYDLQRDFKKTISPSMDILISSNLERFLFEITEHDHEKIVKWYQSLNKTGKFEIDLASKEKINSLFKGEYATEEETKITIKETYEKYNYLLDTHTAVGLQAYAKYLATVSDLKPTIIDATANPYKFSKAVLEALGEEVLGRDEFEILARLKEKTQIEIHRGLKGLDQKEIRHRRSCNNDQIKNEIKDILELN